nr:FAD-binding protein [Puniceibacterium antarcticum]
MSHALAICNDHGFTVVAFGHGSSTQAVQSGLSIDLTNMTAILPVSPEDMDATIEAGVTREQLNEHLRDTGLFLPIDVGAHAKLRSCHGADIGAAGW